MIDPRFGLCAVAVFAWIVRARRPLVHPVALGVSALAAIDVTRAFAPSARVDAPLWCLWPGVSAWLSWRVWRGEGERAIGAAWVAYAFGIGIAPWWADHPGAYSWAIRAPYAVGPLVSLVAWSQGARGGRARRIAAVLAWSGTVDLFAGALAFDSAWSLAAPLSWATWIAIGGMLARWLTSA